MISDIPIILQNVNLMCDFFPADMERALCRIFLTFEISLTLVENLNIMSKVGNYTTAGLYVYEEIIKN